MLSIILKEPLLHFLTIGLILFLVYGYIEKDKYSDTPEKIVVDRSKLLVFLQYRSKVFDNQNFSDILNNMPGKQLRKLIDDYAREEALYREAKTLSLDKNNYIARKRLIQIR